MILEKEVDPHRSFQIVVAASLHLAKAVSRVNPDIINGVESESLPFRYSSGQQRYASRCIRCSIEPSPSQPWQLTETVEGITDE